MYYLLFCTKKSIYLPRCNINHHDILEKLYYIFSPNNIIRSSLSFYYLCAMKWLIQLAIRYVPRKYLQLISQPLLRLIAFFYQGDQVFCPVD